MNRRNAIKNLSLSLGYVVAAPTVMNILSSCTEDVETWTPEFLSNEQKNMVTHLVDIILPTSEIPGALDVNAPQFIDKMYKHIEKEANQKMFQQGAAIFAGKFEAMFDKKALKGKRSDFEMLFASYFKLTDEEIQHILAEQRLKQSKVSENKLDIYLMYKFLFSVRYYTLFGYYTSEKIGKEVLNYDPIPGSYQACVPLEDIGNAWTL